MADDKKTAAVAAPKQTRTRAPNKAKTRGQILGAVIDQFEAMSPEVREEVMTFLRGRYPRPPMPRGDFGSHVA